MVITAPAMTGVNTDVKLKSDYVLMIVQCFLGILVFYLPNRLAKKQELEIPSKMYFAYLIFLYCAIYLGEVQSFYYIVPHWDTIMHGFSAGMWCALGFSLITLLNEAEDINLKVSPIFCAIFAFCFAAAIGAVWEVYEFVVDGIMKTNMQKFMLKSGELLVGRSALADTMKDIIVDICGALIMSIVGYFSLQKTSEWLKKFKFKKHIYIDEKKKTRKN